MRRHWLAFAGLAAFTLIGCGEKTESQPYGRPDDGWPDEEVGIGIPDMASDLGVASDMGSTTADVGDADMGSSDMSPGDVGADAQMPDLGPMVRPIGPRPVTPTPANEGTLFAAPDGSGQDCTMAAPCDVWEVVNQAAEGDVVFLRGGVYDIDRNLHFRGRGSNPPAIFESYPGEVAILDGSNLDSTDGVYIRVLDDPIVLRLFEVRNMPKMGIAVRSSDNVLEGLRVYDNLLSGIHVHESYEVPSSNNNLITDCEVFGNSGAGLGGAEYADGGNSDGISMSSGVGNRVENCLVYGNSDDGIDTWRTTDSYVGYTIAYGNGIASGNGNGFKAGGAPPSSGTTVEHCLSYSNTSVGFDHNSGQNVTFSYNTSWDNGRGYWLGDDTSADHNVAFEATNPANNAGTHDDNSWDRSGTPTPLSTDESSRDFLVPAAGFDDIGAHANR